MGRIDNLRMVSPMATVEVDQDLCVGDQICASMEPEIFEMRDDGLAYVVDGMGELEDEAMIEAAKEAADACPVDAITVSE
ncbi:hypothetical protein HSR121_2107 [Halapricum desulfuricans]|nr:hypothetical protein HSR121_2107 [Halapricum desulfuricans]